jgi:ABC-2 type transport system permease protein
MILKIARKEMTEMMRDGRFRIAGAIVFTLLAGALLLGWRHYREVSAQHAAAQRASRQQWLSQGKKNPHSAAHYGVYAFKPKLPLMMVDRGTDPYTGVAVWLEAHKQNEFKYRPAQDATAVQRFGELTGSTVLQLLVPLLIVLLAFQTLSGEREQGTWRQLLSLGVSPSALARGKALGVAGALGLLLVPATILGVIALTLASSRTEMAATVPRMAWMTLAYLLYFAIFIGASLTVSAWAPSSRAALIGLLGFWMFNGLIAPRASSDVAKALRPTPSAFEFAQQLETGLHGSGDDSSGARIKRLEEELLKKYNVSRIEDLPVNFNGARLQEGENHGNGVFDAAYSQLWKTFSEQDGIRRVASVAAPALAVQSASMAFAGSDFPQHVHFAKAAEEYRRMIQRVLNEDLIRNASNTQAYFANDDLWAHVPPFEYAAPGVEWVLGRQLPSLGVLAFWAVALAFCAIRGVNRAGVVQA